MFSSLVFVRGFVVGVLCVSASDGGLDDIDRRGTKTEQ